ncbi:hypothetical protein FRC14_003160 [Serendipita sp. 396]|nr:hypothetical protein FRC14_003160 [Serendipita sp. 396]KAG8783935.1 hypothetical protein FRC15_004277 [Serendipita sp. 397]KAG8800062.1 hypothetical protein FRC16_003797 [Serendipita sp. 398]KAG8868164.1 hypothetical protein FRC20_004027 [Serendipita sp. 405]
MARTPVTDRWNTQINTIGATTSPESLWGASQDAVQPSVARGDTLAEGASGSDYIRSTNIDLSRDTADSYVSNGILDNDVPAYTSGMCAEESVDSALARINPQALPFPTRNKEFILSSFALLDLVGNHDIPSVYNNLDASITPDGGYARPASLESLDSHHFQAGDNSYLMSMSVTPWAPVSTPRDHTNAISTISLHSNTAPPSRQVCQCACRSRDRSISQRMEPPYPSFSQSSRHSSEGELKFGRGVRNSRQRRPQAHFPTLSYEPTNFPNYQDLPPEPSRGTVVTTTTNMIEEQEKRSDPPTFGKMEEILNALENKESDEHVTSLLLGLLHLTNVNVTDGKDNNSPQNQGKGPQTYTCLFGHCGKRLERKDRALGHVRMHFGYRPYVCNGECGVEKCKEAFACHSYLKSHKQRPKETCPKCSTSVFKKDFARHILLCPSHGTGKRQ